MRKTKLIYGFGISFSLISLIGIVFNIYTLINPKYVHFPLWEPYFVIFWFALCLLASLCILFGDQKRGILGCNGLGALLFLMLILGKIFDIGLKSLLVQGVLFAAFAANKNFREYFKWER